MACPRPEEKDAHLSCVYVHACSCVCLCTCVPVCGSQDNARRYPSVDVLTVFKTGFLSGLELRVSTGICTPPPPQNQSQHTPASHGVGTQLRPCLLLSVNTADDL